MIDLRHGKWEDVLSGVEVDCVMSDPPYSARTQDGHADGVSAARMFDVANRKLRRTNGAAWEEKYAARIANGEVSGRRAIRYTHWTPADVRNFVDSWAPRNRGWFVCLSDHHLCREYEAAFEAHGLTTFAPVGILISGMTVRLAGDGPSSWMLYANVARPKKLSKWGTLPGGYTGPPGERVHIGGKPLWLMRALIRDYTRKGDLVCDPCAGAATTLIAAASENRRAIGAEVDPKTYEVAMQRIGRGYTPSLDFCAP
jgi:hypothetical protein